MYYCFFSHKSIKIEILFKIIQINYYFMFSNQYNSYFDININKYSVLC